MSVPSKPSHLIPAQQTLHDPAVAPTVETSPQSLGLEGSEHQDHDNHLSESGRRRRLSSVVEKTTEKLARSLSTKSRPSSSHGGSGHRSLFSMSRKGRKSGGGDDGERGAEEIGTYIDRMIRRRYHPCQLALEHFRRSR